MRSLIALTFFGVLFGVLVLGASAAQAEFEIQQLEHVGADCSAPQVASSDNGWTMVAYTYIGELLMSFISTQLIPTVAYPDVVWPEPVPLGAGSDCRLCWSRDGWTLAILSGNVIKLLQSDLDGQWDTGDYTTIYTEGEVMSLDLWGVEGDAAGPSVFMTYMIGSGSPWDGSHVYYSAKVGDNWMPPELMAMTESMLSWPQITWSIGSAGPWPTIFYIDGDFGDARLYHTTRNPPAGYGVWSEPVAVPGDGISSPTGYGGEFDVVTPTILEREILGVGEQPACPCNVMLHQYHAPGLGWSETQNIAVDYDDFDWPMSPCLDVDSENMVHAFWYQLGSTPYLEPHTSNLEYRVGRAGQLIDAGDFLDDALNSGSNRNGTRSSFGRRVALDVSPHDKPVLAWTRIDTIDGQPQHEQVWVARVSDLSPVGDEIPRASNTLKAWPNPFNPRVQLDFSVAEAGPARLEIYDARGRVVSRLINSHLADGPHQVYWNGVDQGERNLPSGVYFARLETDAGVVVQKLMLTR